jgi:hypothetical protein
MCRALAVLALWPGVSAAQPATSLPAPTHPVAPRSPPRWLAHLTMHHGLGFASDSIDDRGASAVGVAFGFQAGAQWRLTPQLSLGGALDLTYQQHPSDAEAAAEAKYLHYFPTLVGRFDLGRFAATGWAGYHRGTRRITAPGGFLGSDRTLAENDIGGPVVAAAFVVRIPVPKTSQSLTIELGPFVQAARFSAEDGAVSTMVVGLCSQVVFQGPPIAGDSW